MKRYRWLLLAAALAAVLALQYRTLRGFVSGFPLQRGEVETLALVKVAPVKKVSLAAEIIAAGELEAVHEEQAVSQVSGYVEQVRFKVGEPVTKGQVVITFKVRDAQQRIEQIDANLRNLQAQLRDQESRLEESEKQLEKVRDLRSRDLIATKDLASAETKTETVRAEKELVNAQVNQQQAALAQLRYTLKTPQVTAPLSGVVTESFVEAGGFVQNSWPILTVAAPDPLKVVIKVSEQEAAQLRPGMSAMVSPEDKPDQAFTGKIAGLDRSRAAKEAVVLVEIQLANGQRQLTLGTGVSVVFKLAGSREALLIPQPALLLVDGQPTVYLMVNDRALAQPVTTRPHRDGMLEVLQGLEENQQVIVDNPAGLKPNSKIRLEAKKP